MAQLLKQSTAVVISFGPFVDKTDGVTLEIALVTPLDHASTGILLSKNGGALTIRHATVTPTTYDAHGCYRVTLDTTDTNTLGHLRVIWTDPATCVAVWADYTIVAANVYDSLIGGGDILDVSMTQILGTAVSTPATAGILDVNIKNIDNDAASASGTVTFPNATLASTTNITAGTITTVTTVTAVTGLTAATVHADLDDIQARLPAALSSGGFMKSDIETIKTNAVVNGGTVTFPTNATLASTTNITAGTLTTVTTATNVTTVNGLAANVITAASIADGAIDAATFAAAAITSTVLADGAITAAKIADGAIDALTFAAGAIDAAAIAADAGTEIGTAVWATATRILTAGTNIGVLSAAQTAAAVLDAVAADYDDAGSIGEAINSAGAAADPLLSAVPGAYAAGTAGYVLGHNYGHVLLRTTIATLASQTSFTLTAGSANDDAYNGCEIVVEDIATAAQKCVGIVGDYTGSTKTITLQADPAIFTMAETDKVAILASRALKPTVANRNLDVSTGGEAGIDWNNIGSATATVSFTNTTVATVTTTATATAVTTVNGLASGVITATSIASDAITAAKIADGAIDAATFAAGAITATVIATGAIDADALAADAGTEIGTAVWATTTRLLTAGTNIGVLSAAQTAAAVWDALLADYDTVNTMGEAMATAGGSGASAAEIADAVWDEIMSGHVTAGSAGASQQAVHASAVNASASIGATTFVLTTSVGADDKLIGSAVHFISGTGANQAPAVVTDYVHSTKVVTISSGLSAAINTDTVVVFKPLGIVPMTATTLADTVWDAATADHSDAGSTGEAVDSGGGGGGGGAGGGAPVTRWRVPRNITSQITRLFLVDPTTGEPLTGLLYNTTDFSCLRIRGGQAQSSAVTLATIADEASSFVSLGFVECDEAGGWYRFDPSDAAMALSEHSIRYAFYYEIAGTVYCVGILEIEFEGNVVRRGVLQTGTSTSVTLDTSASSVTDFYVGCLVRMEAGTGVGQSRRITAYNGTTKVATVDRAWATTPAIGATFVIVNDEGPKVDSSLQVTSSSGGGGSGGGGLATTHDILKRATTSNQRRVYLVDPTTGRGKTGLAFGTSGLTCMLTLSGNNNSGAVTLATLASESASFASLGFVEINSTTLPGWYRFDPSNANIANTNGILRYTFYLDISGSIYTLGVLEIRLVDYDPLADQFTGVSLTELTSAPDSTPTRDEALTLLYMKARNKIITTTVTEALRNNADDDDVLTHPLSDNGTQFVRGTAT